MEKKEKTVASVVLGAISGIIMIVCILVYIILGVIIGFWHPGWLIIVGGALCVAIVNIIANLFNDIKELKSHENKQEDNNQEK